MSRQRDCYVYLIAAVNDGRLVGPVKVGMADDPHKRLSGLQTGHPNELQIAAMFAMPHRSIAREVEHAFHHVMRRRRIRGEWFDMEVPDAILAMCVNIRTALTHRAGLHGSEFEAALHYSGVLDREANLRLHGYLPNETLQ